MATIVYLNTKFTGFHHNNTIISIGLVAETGESFYAEFSDYDTMQLDNDLMMKIVAHLEVNLPSIWDLTAEDLKSVRCRGTKEEIGEGLREWFKQFTQVEIWGDGLSYDWVLFCDLFGGATTLPDNVQFIPYDFCTLLKIKGIDPKISREELARANGNMAAYKKHSALYDAVLLKNCKERVA